MSALDGVSDIFDPADWDDVPGFEDLTDLTYHRAKAHGTVRVAFDRPDVLNAFDRQMCEEVRDVWHVVKADDRVNAVVLRAAGERAFSAGLDTSKSFGQPDLVWNHDDPGELLSPKWQKCWKPVVCAVQGMCTAGALYFVNEADVVVCSDDATFFDSHVTYGYVSALEPIGRASCRERVCSVV